jgi:succinate dehydrogenase hydrophobic anchor subunit|tara:strand:+ start:1827 stop:2639 length:813 start_codon:yes stop_codon:yes gene_type:complete
VKKRLERFISHRLDQVPIASVYVKSRGWYFVIAWAHRLCGILMVLFASVHIYTLSFLSTPALYDAKIKFFGLAPFAFLSWMLAIPVIFHALNGGRLILYEMFGSRNDNSMTRWVFSLSIAFVFLQGLLMMLWSRSVSMLFFWLVAATINSSLACIVISKSWKATGSIFWKFHRITGSFLLIMVPAHLMLMHLQPGISQEAAMVIARIQNPFIKWIDLGMLFAMLYHGGYGLISITGDYIESKVLQNGLAALIFLTMAAFGWIGTRLAIMI